MSETKVSAAAFADTKPHYNILDGLRGVAALMVVWFHVFEAFATSHVDQRINHCCSPDADWRRLPYGVPTATYARGSR